MTLIWVIGHPYVVYRGACLLRRWRKKKSVLLRCWLVVRLSLAIARGHLRSSWWRRKTAIPVFVLNDVTTKEAYPLPRIDDTLDMLAGKQWFSTLDLASGYWQVSLSQEARIKTAFASILAYFSFKLFHLASVMPHRPLNVWWTRYSRVSRTRCLVYLDDIISFGTVHGTYRWSAWLGVRPCKDWGSQIVAGSWLS